jgi:hypothetical protein
MDKVIKWEIIRLGATLMRAVIIIAVIAGALRYICDNGIQSICETIWYGRNG